MKYQVEKLKSSAKFNFTVPTTEWEAANDAAYAKNKGKFNVPGFRKGHVPKKVIEKMYGAGVFFDDAFNDVASSCYSTALNENLDLIPVSNPKVDLGDFNDKEIAFSIEVTIKPDAELGEYKGLTVEKAEYPVSDADVDAEIEKSLQQKARTVEVTDRAVQNGDIIRLDYSGSVGGVQFNGGTAKDQELTIGSNSFIPGFEEQMIGINIGENKDINVKFPDEYHAEDLKGKDAIFNVTVLKISMREVPALDDEFVKDTTKFETVAEYKADVKQKLTEQNNKRADNENKNKLIEKIVENATVEVPESMVESETEYMLQDLEYRLAYMYGGMKIDDYFKYTGSSKEDFKKDRAEDAKKQVKTRLVMEQVIKAEKIEATDAEVDAKIAEIAAEAQKEVEEYKKTLVSQQLEQIKSDVILTKTLDFITKENNFVAKKEENK